LAREDCLSDKQVIEEFFEVAEESEKGISFNVFRKWEYAGLEFQEEVKTPDGNHRAEEDGHMVLVVKGFKRYIGL